MACPIMPMLTRRLTAATKTRDRSRRFRAVRFMRLRRPSEANSDSMAGVLAAFLFCWG